jgi:hypothetical protein
MSIQAVLALGAASSGLAAGGEVLRVRLFHDDVPPVMTRRMGLAA